MISDAYSAKTYVTCARLTCILSGDRHCRIKKHVTANVTSTLALDATKSHRIHDHELRRVAVAIYI
jgi:hypothetical protein